MTEYLLRERIVGLELTPAIAAPPIELVIAAWLDAKSHHSDSSETAKAYTATIEKFRAALSQVDLDLASDYRAVALVAQAFAASGRVSAATHNRRLAIVSSFYRFGIQHGLLAPPNPIELVERRRVRPYRRAQPLDAGVVKRKLAAIDRGDLVGARDYALLSVALVTGRRLSELAGLRGADVYLGADGKIKLTWRRCKGDEVMYDTLPPPLSKTLLGYLHRVYGADIGALPHDAAVWVSTSNNNRGGPIGIQTVADICQKRLGTSKVHSLRHTFAHAMEDAGASVSAIQRRLGHVSAATTGIYLEALRRAENDQAEAIVRMLGVEG